VGGSQYAASGGSAGPLPALQEGQPYDIARTYALVTYVAQTPVPADISQLTTMIVAHWMRVNLHPERHEVEQIRAGDQLQIRYAMHAEGLPPDIREMLAVRRRPGVFG
jgi:hypothetical protein